MILRAISSVSLVFYLSFSLDVASFKDFLRYSVDTIALSAGCDLNVMNVGPS